MIKILRYIKNKLKSHKDTYYKVGKNVLILPYYHALPVYQKRFKLYDKALGHIANFLYSKNGKFYAIDIGANIGDSAALINNKYTIPTLCIEGSEEYLPYLRQNQERLGSHITIVDKFIGFDNLKTKKLNQKGTLTLSNSTHEFKSSINTLNHILDAHPKHKKSKLIKLDTDGYDFSILLNNLNFIKICQPILFFEYTLHYHSESERESLLVIQHLSNIGYTYFAVYDNFGHLMTIVNKDYIERFREINNYLKSNQFFGTAVYGIDICAFNANDADLYHYLHAEN